MTVSCLRTYLLYLLCLFSLVLMGSCGGSSTPTIPPPQGLEFVYVGNVGDRNISAFQIDNTGQLQEIAGSPFQPAYSVAHADPLSRFLLVVQDAGEVPAVIESSHALSFNSKTAIPGGWELMDALGRFFYTSQATSETDFNPIHVYSVTADLSFPEVPGSPFDLGIRPLAIHPAGKFLFGFNSNEVVTVQIGATGTLTRISSVPAIALPWDIYIHPSGEFLYVEERASDWSRGLACVQNRFGRSFNIGGVRNEPCA